MEDIKETVTPTETEVVKVEEKLLTQKEVDEIVKERVLREKTKFAKDLGIGEEFDKTKYEEFKKYLDSQKTVADKTQEELVNWKNKYSSLEKQVQETTLESNIKNVLTELEVDHNKISLVKKLIDTTDLFNEEGFNNEELVNRITKVIDEDLPELKKSMPKVGVEKQEEGYSRKDDSAFLDAYKKLKK